MPPASIARRTKICASEIAARGAVALGSRGGSVVVDALWMQDGAKGRFETTIACFTVQSNHMHLIVESVDEQKLAAAMKGLSVRIAKSLNRAAGKHGQVIDSRYHTRYLRTPTEVKHAVTYVLRNHTKHTGRRGVDPYASLAHPELVTPARTWLLRNVAAG